MNHDFLELFKHTEVDDAVDYAFDALERADNDISHLPAHLQVFLRVYSAQGILDNGGLQYFFESNFEDRPPYCLFVNAYLTIGASNSANLLDQAIAMFNIPDPHLDADARQAVMEMLWNDPTEAFADLDLKLCDDESVWGKLRDYVLSHRDDFGL